MSDTTSTEDITPDCSLLEQLPIASFSMDATTGRLSYVNSELEALLQATSLELTDQIPVRDLFHSDDLAELERWEKLPAGVVHRSLLRTKVGKSGFQPFVFKIRVIDNDTGRLTIVGTVEPAEFSRATPPINADLHDSRLAYHRKFEQLIIRSSARIVRATSEETDQAINDILKQVCQLVPLRQCHLVQVHDVSPVKLSITHEFCPEGQNSVLGHFKFVPAHIVSWLYKKIASPVDVMIRDLDQVPEESPFFGKLLRGNNADSYLIVPLTVKSDRWGFLGLVPDSPENSQVWDEDTRSLVRIIGELIYGWLNRARHDDEIRRNQQQWSAIASAASDLLAIIEPDGMIKAARYGDSNAEEYAKSIVGQSIYDLVTPRFRKTLRYNINDILSDETHQTYRDFEYIGCSPEGKELWYRGRLGPYILDEPNTCISFFATSIQSHKETEARSQSLQSELEYATRLTLLGNMSVEVAHQFHQPLQVIESYVDGCRNLIERDKATKESLGVALNGVSKAVRKASQIISRLQHFVRRREPKLQVTSINTVAENAIRLAGATIRRNNVELRQQLTHGLPAIQVDPMQITHVLLNLILNGVEAIVASAGTKAVLNFSTRPSSGDFIRVSVIDTGSGVPAEHLGQIFEQFFTTKKTGLGLGLAQSRNIIETHNGRVWIERSDKTGTEFCVEIPTVDTSGNDTAEIDVKTPDELRAAVSQKSNV